MKKNVKKLKFISLLLIAIPTICLIFKSEKANHYSFEELIELLSSTKTMVICRYRNKYSTNECSKESVIKTITDDKAINDVISLISSSSVSNGYANMIGSGTRLYMMDSNNKTILKVIYSPYLGLEKDSTSYNLTEENKLNY